jgi:hypothetical protein
MARMLSPDDKCIEFDMPTVAGNHRYRGKTIEVTDSRHEKVLKAVGYTVADVSAAPVRSGGYKCIECGFKAFFNRCGRCGGDCEKG